ITGIPVLFQEVGMGFQQKRITGPKLNITNFFLDALTIARDRQNHRVIELSKTPLFNRPSIYRVRGRDNRLNKKMYASRGVELEQLVGGRVQSLGLLKIYDRIYNSGENESVIALQRYLGIHGRHDLPIPIYFNQKKTGEITQPRLLDRLSRQCAVL